MKIITLLISYNEEDIIWHALDYCSRYSDKIIVVDNESKDKTVEIAKSLGADVLTFSTGGRVDDQRMIDVFNSSNKFLKEKDEWIFCHAVDEFILPIYDGFRGTLQSVTEKGFEYIETLSYDMVNVDELRFEGNIVDHVRKGVLGKTPWGKKTVAYRFGQYALWDIGAHSFSYPVNAKISKSDFVMAHYKYGWGINRVLNRHRSLWLSENNLKHGWGQHYTQHQVVMEYYKDLLAKAKEVF